MKIARRLGPALVPAVTGDPDRLEQVLTNLIDNAMGHSPQGRTVTVTMVAEGTTRVVLTVEDEGEGISAQDTERVFERFQTTPKVTGPALAWRSPGKSYGRTGESSWLRVPRVAERS